MMGSGRTDVLVLLFRLFSHCFHSMSVLKDKFSFLPLKVHYEILHDVTSFDIPCKY